MRNSKGQFVKGSISWNKGIPQTKETREKIKKTKLGKLRKGNPENWKHTKETKEKLRQKQIGQHHSTETEFKKNDKRITGKNSYQWKGEDVGYNGVHSWIKRQKGKASNHICEFCGKQAQHWANVDHKYHRNLDDFISLCAKCHRKYDIKNNFI